MVIEMSRKIPEEIVNEVRAQNDIVEVISEYVQLTRRGRNYFGLCPFHEEKTPSFSVEQEKQLFHCFGCGKGGNVFTFIQEIEQINYVDAIQLLAKRVDLELPSIGTDRPSYSKEAEQVFVAYDWLVKFYHHLLKYSEHGKEALKYLQKRGITEETIDRFQLGFSPHDSDLTVQFLQQKQFPLPFLVKHRLLNTTDQERHVDPFRGRIVFPIENLHGKSVAFGGRALGDEQPKYLNSPEHQLFHKAQILYNFGNARAHIRKLNEVIVFEGYLDVLAAHQAKIPNVVATLGTALSEKQAQLLKQTAKTVILCYDGDEAGLTASFEAAQLLNKQKVDVRIARLPDRLDPDDYLRKYGSESFRREIIEVSDPYITFFMHYKKRAYNMSVDHERIRYIEDMAKQLARLDSLIEREFYAKELAKEFEVSEQVIIQDIEQYREKISNDKKDNRTYNRNTNIHIDNSTKPLVPAYLQAEKRLIAHMISYPHLIERVQTEIGIHFNEPIHQVIVTHLYGLYEESNSIDVSELVDKVNDEQIKNVITNLAMLDTNEEHNEMEINDYIRRIKSESTDKARLRELKQKQKLEKNPILAAEIGMKIIELKKQMKSL